MKMIDDSFKMEIHDLIQMALEDLEEPMHLDDLLDFVSSNFSRTLTEAEKKWIKRYYKKVIG